MTKPLAATESAGRFPLAFMSLAILSLAACNREPDSTGFRETLSSLQACTELLANPRKVADDRADRFLGKVVESSANCRGGSQAVAAVRRGAPWVDWRFYWASGDDASRNKRYDEGWARQLLGRGFEAAHLHPDVRGIDGALVDLEYQRVELIKFNLFDNYTFESYVTGVGGVDGRTLKTWSEMRLPPTNPDYERVGGAAPQQTCTGDLIRHRTLTGICNDVFNPLMGSSNTLFARNVEFTEVSPEQGLTELTRNRHADRLSLLQPDPQVISRRLFTRAQHAPELCNGGLGLDNEDPRAECDYLKAPFFNVLAA